MNINVKSYEHFNRSFKDWDSPNGKYISSKAHYERTLAEQNMMTHEQLEKRGVYKKPQHKGYKLSHKAKALMESIKQRTDSKGNVKLSGRQLDALHNVDHSKIMKECGL